MGSSRSKSVLDLDPYIKIEFKSCTVSKEVLEVSEDESQTKLEPCLQIRECPICLELMDGDDIEWLPCIHSYHAKCIHKWAEESRSCPICGYKF